MSDNFVIPDEFQGSIRRLLSRIPPDARNDERLQASLLVYLKLGGEKLARHYLETSRKEFPDQMVLIKKQLHDGVDEEESDENQMDENDTDDDFPSDFSKSDPDDPDLL